MATIRFLRWGDRVVGRLSRIMKGIASGVSKIADQAEKSIGSFERVFGKFDLPGKGMRSDMNANLAATTRSSKHGLRQKMRLGRPGSPSTNKKTGKRRYVPKRGRLKKRGR